MRTPTYDLLIEIQGLAEMIPPSPLLSLTEEELLEEYIYKISLHYYLSGEREVECY